MQSKPRIAIIPARGGSKRLPRKNILPFFGHPMLAYTIVAAQNSSLFERIIVSTDDPLFGRVAEWYGADYLPRPPELATDKAGLVDVAEHVLTTLGDQGLHITDLCQLMPNCPLRRSEDITKHFDLFEQHNRCFQISVVPYRGVYPQWALVSDRHDEAGAWLFGPEFLVASQQLERAYCPTGAIWWVKVNDFLSQHAFYGTPFHLAVMDANRGIDIDRKEELDLADILVRGLRDRDGASPLEPITREAFPGEGLSS